jgi:hypothetical protein
LGRHLLGNGISERVGGRLGVFLREAGLVAQGAGKLQRIERRGGHGFSYCSAWQSSGRMLGNSPPTCKISVGPRS